MKEEEKEEKAAAGRPTPYQRFGGGVEKTAELLINDVALIYGQ